MEKMSDKWRTPDWLWEELDEEFKFDIDLCATQENSKCKRYYEDYLNNTNLISSQSGKVLRISYILPHEVIKNRLVTCFMNPPYSNPRPFIEKAWEDSKHCKIVCLVKCDPSTRWWPTFWNYNNGPKQGCEVRFFPKRIQFYPPIELVKNGEIFGICVDCGTFHFGNDAEAICCENSVFNFKQTCKACYWGSVGKDLKIPCLKCKGKGYKPLSGPSFSCTLVIMDRRNV